jgi:integrase
MRDTRAELEVKKLEMEVEKFGDVVEAKLGHIRQKVWKPDLTALRKLTREILRLTWPQVDLEAGTVRLEAHTTKNDDARPIYLPQLLLDVLEQQWQEHLERYPECPYVFHRSGQRIVNYYPAWHTACREAGVIGKIPHDFRRTAVRNLVRAGVPERLAMAITGHKTRSVFERYNIVSDGDLREAARRLDCAITPRTATTLATLPDTPSVKSLN